jgi:hypothetical protein
VTIEMFKKKKEVSKICTNIENKFKSGILIFKGGRVK